MTAEELRARRQKLGLSQSQLATALQRPVDTIQNWEQGRRRIEMPGILRYVLDALGDYRQQFGGDHEAWIAALPEFLGRTRE